MTQRQTLYINDMINQAISRNAKIDGVKEVIDDIIEYEKDVPMLPEDTDALIEALFEIYTIIYAIEE